MAEHSKKLQRPPKRHRKHAQKPKRTSTEVAAAVAKKKEKRLSTASAVSAASSIMTAGNCTDADKLYAWLGRKTGVTYESHTSSQAQLKREKQERYEQKGELIRQVEQLRASDDQDERARIGDDLVERIARLVDGAVASSAREAARTLSVLDGVKAFRRDRHQYKRMLQRNLELESRMNYMEQGLRAGGGDDDSDLAGRGRAGSDRPGSVDRQLMHVNLKSLRRVSEAEDGYLAVYSQGYEEGYKGGMEDGTAKADREMERRERVARILGPKDRGTQTDRPRPRPPTAPPASRLSRESHVSSPSDRMSDPELEVRPLSLRSSTGRDPATGASGTDDINDGMSDLGHGALLTPIGPPPAMDVDVRSSRRRRGEPQEFPEPPSPQDTVPSPPWDDSDEGDRDALHSSTTITNGHPTAYGAQGYSNSNSNNEEDGEGEGDSYDPSIDVVTGRFSRRTVTFEPRPLRLRSIKSGSNDNASSSSRRDPPPHTPSITTNIASLRDSFLGAVPSLVVRRMALHCLLILGLMYVAYKERAVQKEKDIWLEANGLTRRHLLDHVYEEGRQLEQLGLEAWGSSGNATLSSSSSAWRFTEVLHVDISGWRLPEVDVGDIVMWPWNMVMAFLSSK